MKILSYIPKGKWSVAGDLKGGCTGDDCKFQGNASVRYTF